MICECAFRARANNERRDQVTGPGRLDEED